MRGTAELCNEEMDTTMRSPEREEGGASSPDLKVGASAPLYGETFGPLEVKANLHLVIQFLRDTA
jgi:hypothetical protein